MCGHSYFELSYNSYAVCCRQVASAELLKSPEQLRTDTGVTLSFCSSSVLLLSAPALSVYRPGVQECQQLEVGLCMQHGSFVCSPHQSASSLSQASLAGVAPPHVENEHAATHRWCAGLTLIISSGSLLFIG